MAGYSKYKYSGFSWIGDIPEHWVVKRTKYVATLYSGDSLNDEQKNVYSDFSESDETIPYIASKDIDKDSCSVDYMNGTRIPKKEIKTNGRPFSKAPAGSSLLCIEGGSAGKKRCILDREVNFVNKLCCFVPKINGKFLFYYICSNSYWENFKQNLQGMIGGVTVTKLGTFPIPIPSDNEQKVITGYLDAECLKIDELIAKEEKRKDLLLELRKTVVSSLVTKGVGHAEEIIDSHVNSIGAVPKHWSICQIRRILVSGKDGIKIGPFGSSLTGKVSGDGEYKVYGQWNIIDNDFSAGTSYIEKATFDELCPYQVIGGDVLISMMGTVGKCAIIPENIQCGIMDSHVVKARLNPDKMDKDYFTLMYDKDNSDVVYAQINEVKKGSIMDGLNSSLIKSLRICMPPIEEQREIVAAVKEQTLFIDSDLEKADQRIKLLKEYKISLITEVVTGKRKVC